MWIVEEAWELYHLSILSYSLYSLIVRFCSVLLPSVFPLEDGFDMCYVTFFEVRLKLVVLGHPQTKNPRACHHVLLYTSWFACL